MARERHDGITRTEVSNLFSRNKKAREIDRALQALIDAGRIERAAARDPRQRPRSDGLAPCKQARAIRRLTPQAATRRRPEMCRGPATNCGVRRRISRTLCSVDLVTVCGLVGP